MKTRFFSKKFSFNGVFLPFLTDWVEGVRSNVEDNVTTQLLAEIDGMVHLDNIFLVSTTNTLDSVDLALLRSGRIDTISKVGYPTKMDVLKPSIFTLNRYSAIGYIAPM